MSLNDVLLSDDNYRRDSFSDRFCDDLSELILQFLPFKDKFRFECVSKQFQRTIFQKHYELIIDEIFPLKATITDNNLAKKLSNTRTVYSKLTAKEREDLETILRKLPNIRHLGQNNFPDFLFSDMDSYLLIKMCQKLTSIHCNFRLMTRRKLSEVFQKFVSKMVSISADIHHLQMIEKSVDNIEELNCLIPNYIESIYERGPLSLNVYFPHICDFPFRKLKKLSIELNERKNFIQQLTGFQTFVENNKSLTHLTLRLKVRTAHNLSDVFTEIAKFEDLIHLEIRSNQIVSSLSFYNHLKQIGLKCHKIKRLTLEYVIHGNDTTYNFLIRDHIKYFKSLTHLKISSSDKYFYLDHKTTLSSDILIDIDSCLPNIRVLSVPTPMTVNINTAEILCRLSKLEKLEMKVTDNFIRNLIERKVIEKCRKLRIVSVEYISPQNSTNNPQPNPINMLNQFNHLNHMGLIGLNMDWNFLNF